MKKENTVFLFLTLIIPLMPAFSQNIKYTGTIEYNEVNICNVDGNGNDGTWRWMKKVNNIRDKNTTFNVVFVQGKGFEQIGMGLYSLNLISGDVKLTDNSFDESFREKIRETCLGEDEKGRLSKTWNVSPGESSYHRIRSNKTALDKPVISGMLMFQDGKYSLTIAGEMKELFTMEDYSQDKNPCWQSYPPPKSFTTSAELASALALTAEKDYRDIRILEDTQVIEDKSGKDCNCGTATHALPSGKLDLKCTYTSKISWTWKLKKQCEWLGSVGNELDKRNLPESTKKRINDVLSKLENPDIDSYVIIRWDLISSVREDWQADEVLNDKKKYLADLREYFSDACEKYRDVKMLTDYIINRDRDIVNIINRLHQQMLREHILAPGQVKIKDWMADQQKDPKSIYNCYAGK